MNAPHEFTLITERTPQLSQLSWATSAGGHAAMIVVLGTLITLPAVEKAEVAGARTVIHAAFTEPVTVTSVASPVIEVAPQVEPAPEREPAPDDAADLPTNDQPPRVEPQPLNPPAPATSVDLSQLPQAEAQLPRRQQSASAAHVASPPKVFDEPPLSTSPARQPVVRDSSDISERQPVAHAERPPLTRQRPVVEEILELADTDLPPEPPAAAPQSLGTSETTPARTLDNPSPVYPPDALRRGLEGLVLLRVTIGLDGRVTEVAIAKSSGERELDYSARDAVRRWQFEPATRDGRPVKWTARLPVRFRLN